MWRSPGRSPKRRSDSPTCRGIRFFACAKETIGIQRRVGRTNVRGRAWIALLVVLLTFTLHAQDKRYSVRGMVLRVDPATRTFTVSHEAIEGLMSAMIMPFEVRDARDLMPLAPGALVDF